MCRSLSRTAMITNIDFPVQINFTIHAHTFVVYSCPRLHFIDPTTINISIGVSRCLIFSFHNFLKHSVVTSIFHIWTVVGPMYLCQSSLRYCEKNAVIVQFSSWHLLSFVVPSQHDTLTQCWFNVGPSSATLGQH